MSLNRFAPRRPCSAGVCGASATRSVASPAGKPTIVNECTTTGEWWMLGSSASKTALDEPHSMSRSCLYALRPSPYARRQEGMWVEGMAW